MNPETEEELLKALEKSRNLACFQMWLLIAILAGLLGSLVAKAFS